ncbi:unnamed protein product [Spirodela intermedia]|uniref:Large ribosomal subunit protein uL29c n=1 Tax=Spirodela intermedia TaxID=51605 RepID=A0A7I8IXX2_SPIIN|nr:unnamed protein product [Spirodela intermedia]CAA6662552.1 unnamed protein product [Spirodela intermedia]
MLRLSLPPTPTPFVSPSPRRSTLPPQSSFYGARLRAVAPLLRVRSPLRVGTVRMMAKREEELKEIREMTTEQINEEVIDLKGELFMLRLQKSARNEFKNSEFGRMRKRIEEGINRRLSRKLDRKWKRSIVVRPPPS